MTLKAKQVKKKNPELRFPWFEGEWEEKRLGEVGEFIGGGTPSKKKAEHWKGYIPWISSSDVLEDGLNVSPTRFITEEAVKNSATKLVPKDSLLIVSRVGVGKVAIADVDVCTSQDFTNFFPRQGSDSIFLAHLIKTKIKQLLSFNQGTSIKGFVKDDLSNLTIDLPESTEQQKIALFLTAADEWIGNLKAQKQKWEEYKKGMMQKIFPGGAGQVSEIRFRDKEGNEFPVWEEKRLGEVANIVGGGTPDTTVKNFWGGDVIWLTPTEIKQKYISQSERTITKMGVSRSSATILPIGTILLTTRATIGDVGIAEVECATNQGFQSFVVHDGQSNEFWYYWLIQNKKEFIRRANGSTFSEISGTEIRKIKTLVPSLREQQKIASFLTAVDDMIHLHQQKIAQAEEWKKGLMQRMFV